jgi:DNA primase
MNRVVYLIKERGRVVDAAGRSLDPNIKPKWWRYGKSGNPFVVGRHATGVILEDCASACSVSSYVSGIALLGTNLMDSHIPVLRTFDRLVVALDKDATSKAISMVRKLKPIRPTSLVILDKDVKDMSNDERKRTFERYIP